MAISLRIKEMEKQQFLMKKEDVITKATGKAKQMQYEDMFNDYLENAKNELQSRKRKPTPLGVDVYKAISLISSMGI
ncbi:hypothetical protein [Clostridium botulinum]|uniref:hypothetical protein n=1 Tax=Clostridium botulinum TaxID=1491 RepID=UPI001E3DD3E5|nr:hypothetical protein [Clostridium botulinum]MCD3276695.1 hypothetical protein [Clostridium botulinum C/D]MCD3288280.1 hypothetical protein [Clostridium botulinum C/D]MCD3290803.1 hypothetical protein [Clostridium botulinum C/D]MCD3303787.1 hypothetical protein [Clostridium botulinum C/D]